MRFVNVVLLSSLLVTGLFLVSLLSLSSWKTSPSASTKKEQALSFARQHCPESQVKTVSRYNVALHVCTNADTKYVLNALQSLLMFTPSISADGQFTLHVFLGSLLLLNKDLQEASDIQHKIRRQVADCGCKWNVMFYNCGEDSVPQDRLRPPSMNLTDILLCKAEGLMAVSLVGEHVEELLYLDARSILNHPLTEIWTLFKDFTPTTAVGTVPAPVVDSVSVDSQSFMFDGSSYTTAPGPYQPAPSTQLPVWTRVSGSLLLKMPLVRPPQTHSPTQTQVKLKDRHHILGLIEREDPKSVLVLPCQMSYRDDTPCDQVPWIIQTDRNIFLHKEYHASPLEEQPDDKYTGPHKEGDATSVTWIHTSLGMMLVHNLPVASSLSLTHVPLLLVQMLVHNLSVASSLSLTHVPLLLVQMLVHNLPVASSLSLTHVPLLLVQMLVYNLPVASSLSLTHVPLLLVQMLMLVHNLPVASSLSLTQGNITHGSAGQQGHLVVGSGEPIPDQSQGQSIVPQKRTAVCNQGTASPSATDSLLHQHAVRVSLSALLKMMTLWAEGSLTEQQKKSGWNTKGNIGEVPAEVARYSAVASSPNVKTICEIGFNAGHSSIVLLTANPLAKLYSFDLFSFPFSARCRWLLQKLFPNRFHYIMGSSFDTLPWFKDKHGAQVVCDVFSIDGDHSYEGCMTDMVNAFKLMNVGGIIVADDISRKFPGCKKAFLQLVSQGNLSPPVCEEHIKYFGWDIRRWCTSVLLDKEVDKEVEAKVLRPRGTAPESMAMNVHQEGVII
ncbi:hypothetical protein CEUSTIGMA_g8625.t1 [Chlamydomonas eustigma]|uniref:Methyltransferase domain-containing protein n=1 Tax=Chlamydomonas eustigma TaxID=1157962 RepID=A0A250XE65_9CHLO|nr:hypothetical protein CEUSTIGMA_g8625.t1 [Chlamydomonas eustigma]|eukprot:GAX81192.1 hypothetical protein CEUSTIGMA_g8625.t1 [Chlamydomonas eustigma]